MIYEYARATGAYETVQGLVDLVCVTLQIDDVQLRCGMGACSYQWVRCFQTRILGGLCKSKLQNSRSSSDCRPRRENGKAKTVRSWSWSWGETLGKTNSDFASQEMKLIKQEVKNYLCNNRRILRLRVRWWLTCGIYRTKRFPWPMQEVFHDLEWGSTSGATHVPDRTSTVLSSGTLPCCDSGLPRNTHNGTGIVGNVFERPPA